MFPMEMLILFVSCWCVFRFYSGWAGSLKIFLGEVFSRCFSIDHRLVYHSWIKLSTCRVPDLGVSKSVNDYINHPSEALTQTRMFFITMWDLRH